MAQVELAYQQVLHTMIPENTDSVALHQNERKFLPESVSRDQGDRARRMRKVYEWKRWQNYINQSLDPN